jgi:hypothetical protein
MHTFEVVMKSGDTISGGYSVIKHGTESTEHACRVASRQVLERLRVPSATAIRLSEHAGTAWSEESGIRYAVRVFPVS